MRSGSLSSQPFFLKKTDSLTVGAQPWSAWLCLCRWAAARTLKASKPESRTELFSSFHSGSAGFMWHAAVWTQPKCAQGLDHGALLASSVCLGAQCRERVYQTTAGHVTHPCWCYQLTSSCSCFNSYTREGVLPLSLNVLRLGIKRDKCTINKGKTI